MAGSFKYDVFVAGAGPVGLFFAYLMTAYGHSVYICDPKNGPTTESRAIGFSPRVMSLLQNHNAAHLIMKNATLLQGLQMHILGKNLGTVDAIGDTSFPHITTCPQSETEAAFTKLVGYDNIAWETELVDFTQHADGVEATIKELKTEKIRTVIANYIIGADGSHSTVRKMVDDWRYEGVSISTKFAICDVVLKGEDVVHLGHARVNFFINTEGLCTIIPLGEHNGQYYHRLFCNRDPYIIEDDTQEKKSSHGIDGREPISLVQMQKLIDSRLHPFKIEATSPKWMSAFRISERKANGFRRNRAFLMGAMLDAAHCHSPAGGQGMNLGLQDADNLAWKLSLVLKGLVNEPEILLDSYNAEREPIAELTIKNTSAATRYVLSRNSLLSAFIAQQNITVYLSFDCYKNQIMNGVMQNHIQIPRDSALLSQQPNNDKLIEPGQFIRDTGLLRNRVISDQIHRKTLHEILMKSSTQFTVIWLGTRPSRYDPCTLTSLFWTKFKESAFPIQGAHAIVVESTWHGGYNGVPKFAVGDLMTDETFWWEDHWDVPDALSKRIGLTEHMWDKPESPAAIVIVRPDLYVAYSSLVRSSADIDTGLKFLSSFVKKE